MNVPNRSSRSGGWYTCDIRDAFSTFPAQPHTQFSFSFHECCRRHIVQPFGCVTISMELAVELRQWTQCQEYDSLSADDRCHRGLMWQGPICANKHGMALGLCDNDLAVSTSGSKPGCWIVGSHTRCWLTSEADNHFSSQCVTMPTEDVTRRKA